MVALGILLGYHVVARRPEGDPQPVFRLSPPPKEPAELGKNWRDPSLEEGLKLIGAARTEIGSPLASREAEDSERSVDGFPRTGRSVYETFIVNPGRVDAKDLVCNVVLNPANVSPSEASLASFLSYYQAELALVKEARGLLSRGRSRLAAELVTRGHAPKVTVASIAGHTFHLNGGAVVSGDRLIRMVGKAMGPDVSDQSIVASALTMAGVFGEGDTMHFVGGDMHLIPFSLVESGIPELLSVERAVAMEFVANIHYWFVGLGALANADDLIGQAAVKIMEGRR
ncbi:MAG: hypothetical protein KAI24_25695 [Planctomycetes bacterium]|nr:hypothetical protein [Planctomycetota bacterium]